MPASPAGLILGVPPSGRQRIAVEATPLQKVCFPIHLMGLLLWVGGPAFPKSFGSMVAWCLLSGGPPAPRGRLNGVFMGFIFPHSILNYKVIGC